MNKIDDYLRAYGVDIRAPSRTVAVSPRAPKVKRPNYLTTLVRRWRSKA